MEIATRKVQFLGSTANPNESWMLQMVEKATGDDGLLGGENHSKILLIDRDTKFSKAYQAKLADHDVKASCLATSVTEFERVHGAIHVDVQKRACQSDDLFWQGNAGPCY